MWGGGVGGGCRGGGVMCVSTDMVISTCSLFFFKEKY